MRWRGWRGVEVVGGNFFEWVPPGDCFVASAIIHDGQDDDARTILKAVRAAMMPAARLQLCEAVVGPPNKGSFGKRLDLETMVTGGGRERAAWRARADHL